MNLQDVLQRVDEIYTEYSAVGDHQNYLPVNVEVLADIASRMAGINIKFVCKSWNSTQIKGRVLRYKDHAVIEYSSELNTCWERFVVTKELCHLMLDADEDYTKDVEELVKCLVSCNILEGEPKPAERSEFMCSFAAAELLAPIKIRRDLYENEYRNNNLTTMQIADIFKIPGHYIEIIFSDVYRGKVDALHYEVMNPGI